MSSREGEMILNTKRCLPDEVLSASDGDGHGVSEGMEFDLLVLLEQLLAKEDVEVLVSLVRDVDDVRIFSGGSGGWLCGLHFLSE